MRHMLWELWRRFLFARLPEDKRIGLFKLGSVGQSVRLTGYPNFGSEPFLITIGSHVTISDRVAFVNHDGGLRALRDRHPGLHAYGPIAIGDYAFIGMGTIILPNVTIGERTVIGAGSVVTRDIPDGVVAAGVPCRTLGSIDDYESRSLESGMIWEGAYDELWQQAVVEHVSSSHKKK